MPSTQLFAYEAAINGSTVSSTVECESMIDALRLVNQLHAQAEQITIKKVKQKNARPAPVLSR